MKVKFFTSRYNVQGFLDNHQNINIKFIKQSFSTYASPYDPERFKEDTLISIWYTE